MLSGRRESIVEGVSDVNIFVAASGMHPPGHNCSQMLRKPFTELALFARHFIVD